MSYFPIMLNLDYKKVVVVGGGHVATQKVEALLVTKANIIVVSPMLTATLQHYSQLRKIQWRNKTFEPVDLDDAILIFAATNEETVNDQIEQATQHWQLFMRVDNNGRMDFMNPAVVRRGDFVLTVSTSGASPAFTRQVKQQLSEQFDDSYEAYTSFLKNGRQAILEKFEGEQKRRAVAALLEPQVLQWIQQQDFEQCENYIQQLLEGE
ncbi:bifunctional precorrin-2 dehydrogenase/sirohydrochlorin ferrochelatase [Solibacillus sp. MA9]|uniref:precorrin-2 dehydrogenase n=1 Tax=Solibacillus palustris TaxID=2908203 RepID=A0ABS9UCC0_9BACL|nr:bifunctional precorrin-2 dehydrogenase/sirohydrochlorin ferrochelatase [Solibacillus sp. MA9]MCH7321959.1 bifunctional precorrin-2 dehydrogenase/sirohydrochlorin ferrochelatase [Solibacillus sp. MA9]